MKQITYIAGIIITILSVVLLSGQKTIFQFEDEAYAASGSTSFSVRCKSSDQFFAPSNITTVFSLSESSNPVVNATVSITGAVAGGNQNPSTTTGMSTENPEMAYAIFNSPKMVHVYACQGQNVSKGDVEWKVSGNTGNVYVGSGAAGATSESSFTPVTNSFTKLITGQGFEAGKPRVVYGDGSAKIIIKKNLSASESDAEDVIDIEIHSEIY